VPCRAGMDDLRPAAAAAGKRRQHKARTRAQHKTPADMACADTSCIAVLLTLRHMTMAHTPALAQQHKDRASMVNRRGESGARHTPAILLGT
jgi:hypothetical protein